VLNKKNIFSVLHAPLFLSFSRRTQLVYDVLTFTLTSFSDKWLINTAMSPKCLLDTPVCHPVQKMPHFTDKSAILRQKVWDYFIANSFRLHHGGISGLFRGLDPIREPFFLNQISSITVINSTVFWWKWAINHLNSFKIVQMTGIFKIWRGRPNCQKFKSKSRLSRANEKIQFFSKRSISNNQTYKNVCE